MTLRDPKLLSKKELRPSRRETRLKKRLHKVANSFNNKSLAFQ